MDDVGAGQLAREQRQINQLVDDGAQILDAARKSKAGGWNRIHGNEPRFDVGALAPRVEKSLCLNGLASENIERWRDDGYLNLRHGFSLGRSGRFVQRGRGDVLIALQSTGRAGTTFASTDAYEIDSVC